MSRVHYTVSIGPRIIDRGALRVASFSQALRHLRAVWRAFRDVHISFTP